MKLYFFSYPTADNASTTVFLKVVLFLIIVINFQCSVAFGRNARHSRLHQHIEEQNDMGEIWETKPLVLIDVSGEEDSSPVDDNFQRKRIIRSPLDDEIDEVQDSDEDGDEEDELSSEKNMKESTPVPTTIKSSAIGHTEHVKVVTTVSPIGNEKSDHKVDFHNATTLPGHHITNKNASNGVTTPKYAANSANRTQGAFPLGLQGSRPPGPITGVRSSPAGSLPVPHGGRPIHGGIPPFPGKLPPHLLKNLPKPKPPPKKGELYLPEDYNNLVIPKLNLGKLIGIDSYSAVPVLVFLNIRSVRDIDETMETLTLDLDLVIEWVDGFLFDPISAITIRQADITLNPIFLKKIWRPDIYIDEIVKVKRTSLMSKPLKLKFNPSNGFISYTTRLTVQLSCDMIYIYYPADTHRCEFTFRSYSYFSKDMELSWLGAGVYLQDPYDPNFDLQVESIDRVKLPQTFRKLTNDTYDGLKFTLLARRKLSFHMVQTYLPSIFFIVITWLCFLVPARMVEARIGISMTTLLTLTSMFASVRESTPIVSYVKAIDIWMVFCIFFVFLTLLEFATLVWLRSRREDAEELNLEQQRKRQAMKGTGKSKDLEASLPRKLSSESMKLQKYEKFAEFTEKFAFFIFSVVFLIFNIIYWSWLLIASDYYDWSVNTTLNADLD